MFFAVAWGASAVVFLFSSQFGIAHYVHPITLTCMFALFLINTLNFNFRHCRFWLLKALVSAFYLKIVFNSSYIVLMIYEINHIWTAEMKWKWRNDRRSERNSCNCGFEPVTSRLPVRCSSNWDGNISTHNWPAPNVSGFIAQLVEHRTGNRESTALSVVPTYRTKRSWFQFLAPCRPHSLTFSYY